MGTAYRITPIYLKPVGAGTSKILIDDQRHLTGSTINFNVGYYFTGLKLTTSLDSDFRYDLVAFEKPDGRFSASRRDLIGDYIIRIDKDISLREESSLLLGIGYGFMNNGTEFGLQSQAGTVSGSPVYVVQLVDLSYKSFMFSVGYQIVPWSISMNAFLSRGNEFFNEKGSFILPELLIRRKVF